jgi:hypothetical protein
MADEQNITLRDPHAGTRAHTTAGPYIIAPDSAEPWPDEIWQRIDLEELNESMTQIDSLRAEATADELQDFTSPRGFFIPERDRDLLRRIGGTAATDALHRLEEQ